MDDKPRRRTLRAGDVTRATKSELDELGVLSATNAQAAAAVRLAKELDSAGDPRHAAAVARELRQAMAVVRAAAPPTERGDRHDRVAQQREERQARARAAGGAG
ncbi:hypothetical protein [Streptomyces sp. NPDC050535]|uniref:hypothetical protein n=1 Tax=Streptomyces sp. NPDC050535 TaxID=3365626 RepID=UPI0037ABBE1A